VPANYLALCRDWLTDFQPPPAPCPSACSRQLLPYGVLACAPDLRYPTLPDAPTGNDLFCYGAMNWPVQCEDLSKLTVQAILMGPSTLVGDDVDEYLHLANEFLDAIIFEHPTYLNEPNELTEEARKAARSGTHNALALLQGAQAGAPGLHSTLILSSPGMLRAVLVVLHRLLLADAAGQTALDLGAPIGVRDNAEAFGFCLRRLGQIFLVLARTPARSKVLLDLHVHFTHLLRQVVGPDSRCWERMAPWFPPVRYLHYCMMILQRSLLALHFQEPFVFEHEEITKSVLLAWLGLALHHKRFLQHGLRQCINEQLDEGLCPIALITAALSVPGATLPAAVLLREILRDCPTEYEDAAYANLSTVVAFLRQNPRPTSRSNIVALSGVFESFWWLAFHNPHRFAEEGQAAIYGLLWRLLGVGRRENPSSGYGYGTAYGYDEQPSAGELEFDNSIFSLAAFYLSAVLHLCPKLGRWVFDAARTAGEAAEGAGRSLEGFCAALGPHSLLSHHRAPMNRMLFKQPEEALAVLEAHYASHLQELNLAVRMLMPSDIEALVQRLDPGRTSSPEFGEALRPSNAYTLDSPRSGMSPRSGLSPRSGRRDFVPPTPAGAAQFREPGVPSMAEISLGRRPRRDMSPNGVGYFG